MNLVRPVLTQVVSRRQHSVVPVPGGHRGVLPQRLRRDTRQQRWPARLSWYRRHVHLPLLPHHCREQTKIISFRGNVGGGAATFATLLAAANKTNQLVS